MDKNDVNSGLKQNKGSNLYPES